MTELNIISRCKFDLGDMCGGRKTECGKNDEIYYAGSAAILAGQVFENI
jgi:hypothetical protein